MKNNILITGAAGNIGTYLVENFDPSVDAHLRLLVRNANLSPYLNLPPGTTCETIYANLLTDNIDKYLPGITHVIHLAALTDTTESHQKPQEYIAMNLDVVRRVADACLKKDIKLLFPSTTSIYASRQPVIDETCAELKSYSPYAKAKLEAEKYLLQLREKELCFAICRLGTVFGYSNGIRFNTAINKFVWQAMTNAPLTVWKTVWKQKRPYLHIKDCAQAINFILKKDLFGGEVYNVLSGNYTVEEVVGTIRQFYPALTVNFVDSPPINHLSYELQDSKIRRLGFKPKGTLLDGIKETIDQLEKQGGLK